MNTKIELPVSFGEALDKLTILTIKMKKITDSRKADVEKEFNILNSKLEKYKIMVYFFFFGLSLFDPPLPRPLIFPACTFNGLALILRFVFLSTKMFLKRRASASGNFVAMYYFTSVIFLIFVMLSLFYLFHYFLSH